MSSSAFTLPSASNFADRLNPLFYTLLALTFVFAGGVIFFTVYWSVKYRANSPIHRKRPEHESRPLEVVLIGLPLCLGLGVFVWGASIFADQRTIPPDAIEIFVLGKQWMWHIQHSNGAREMNHLTIPVNRPIRLTMVSQDVIHEFYIPAFRTQYQVLPGRYTSEWFVPNKIGQYTFLCNQYCGKDHSRMHGLVDVVSDPDYDKWLENNARPGSGATKPLLQAGRELFQSQNCVECHGAADSPLGPSLLGVFGKTRTFVGGGALVADEDYLRESIVSPGKQIVSGYTNSMPAYSELDERQLWALVTYLRSLREAGQLPPVKARAPALEGAH